MRPIFFLLFFSFPLFLYGDPGIVTLRGDSALAWAGMHFPVLGRSDMITGVQDTLGVLEVRKDGSFSISFPVPGTMEVDLFPGIYKLYLYVIPGRSYRLRLPPRKDKTISDVLNPYFRAEEYPWLPETDTAGELNHLILRFEEMYTPRFYRHATMVALQARDTTLRDFMEAVRDSFATVKDPFFTDWMAARLAMLETMNLPEREQVLIKYRDFGNSVRLYNPAYMELFNQVFRNYFNYLTRHRHMKALRSVVEHGDGDSLRLLIRKDLQVQYRDFTDLAGLKGIYDAWYNKTFPEKKLLALLQSFSESIAAPGIRKVSANLLRRFNTLRPGTPAPSFLLEALDGKKYRPEDFRGKYLYLNFSSRLSYSSLRQFPLLTDLLEQYGDHLAVVTVAIEDQPDKLRAFVTDKGYSWPFLLCGTECAVAARYEVRGYPTYFLIGPEGKILLAPAPAPTENFGEKFRDILIKAGLRKEEVSLPAEHQ